MPTRCLRGIQDSERKAIKFSRLDMSSFGEGILNQRVFFPTNLREALNINLPPRFVASSLIIRLWLRVVSEEGKMLKVSFKCLSCGALIEFTTPNVDMINASVLESHFTLANTCQFASGRLSVTKLGKQAGSWHVGITKSTWLATTTFKPAPAKA